MSVFEAAGDTSASSGVQFHHRKFRLLVTFYQKGETSSSASVLLMTDLRSKISQGLTLMHLYTSERVQSHSILIYLHSQV